MTIRMTTITCMQCGKPRERSVYEARRCKTHFCCISCSNKYKAEKGINKNNRNGKYVGVSNINYSAEKPKNCPVPVNLCTECTLEDCRF